MITGIESNQPTKINRITTGECLLSISLLVSNQKRTIRKCMESIRPLLEQVPSELIVVDTVGEANSDGSLAIAKEYADKIVHFTWCDDFAKARNAGLAQCQGKWFMFLDDDEYYDDVTSLIDFFHNQELINHYASINVYGRHYDSYQGEKYNKIKSMRLYKLTPESKFIGKVHEYFYPALAPTFTTDAYVHHFGYVQVNNKVNRNEKLLLDMTAQNPQSYLAWMQLISAYSAGKMQKKIALAEEALSHYQQETVLPNEQENALCEIIVTLAEYYQKVGQITKATQLLQDYRELFMVNPFRSGLFDYTTLILEIAQFRFDDVVAIFNRYQSKVIYFLSHEQEMNVQYTPFYKEYLKLPHLLKTLETVTMNLDNIHAFDQLASLFEIVTWQYVNLESKVVLSHFIKAFVYAKKPALLAKCLTYCLENELSEYFIHTCQSLLFELGVEEQERLQSYLAELDADLPYLQFFRYQQTDDEQLFVQLTQSVRYYEAGVEAFLIELIERGISPLAILQTANLGEVQSFVHFVDLYFAGDFVKEAKFIEKIADSLSEEVVGTYLVYQLLKKMILKPSMTTMELETYLTNYLTFGQQLVIQLYSQAVFTQEVMLLPNEFHWLALLEQALDQREQGQLVAYLQLLKQGLQIYPEGKELIEKLMTLAQRDLRKQESVNEELMHLASKVKAEILKLVSEQKVEEAKQVYQELLQIVPMDDSLARIGKYLE